MSNKCQKTYNKEFVDAAYNGDIKTVKAMLEISQVNVYNMCLVQSKQSRTSIGSPKGIQSGSRHEHEPFETG